MSLSVPQSVLLIEPDDPFRKITIKALDVFHCNLRIAGDSREAFRLAEEDAPDLVLLEVDLPGPSGLDFCRQFSTDTRFKQIPLIALSTKHDYKIRLECLQAGAVDFLHKPFLMEELQARVRTHLRLHSLHREALSWHMALADRKRAEALHVFAVGLGHNFNNLLTAGMGFLSLAEEENKSDSIQGYLRNIDLALKRMCGLSRQLLTFTGDLRERKQTTSLHKVFTNALAIFDPMALNKGITIVCDITALGPAKIYCDEFRLTQAFLHLLNNARESLQNDGGRIFIHAALDNKSASILIRDLGKGMTPEEIEHVLDPFYTTKEDVGSGLGLSMVDGLIRDLGGHLTLESRLGEGTAVTIFLPRSEGDAPSADIMRGTFLPGVEILVAVDLDETSQMLQAVLVAQHFHVTAVATLRDLMETLSTHENQFHVIILDLLRSETFGTPLIEMLRDATDIPIIYMISTEHEAPTEFASLQTLRKPFDPETLLGVLQKFPHLVHYE